MQNAGGGHQGSAPSSSSSPPLDGSLTTPLLPPHEEDGDGGHLMHHPVHTTSFAGSVFNLCAATLGAGALSLPFAISSTGVTLGLVLLGIAAAAALLSIDLLVGAMQTSGHGSYESLTAALIGKRTAAVVEFCIFAFCFGTCVAYLIALGDIAQAVIVDHLDLPAWAPQTRSAWMVVVWAVALLPLSLPTSLAALAQASFLGTAALCCLVASVCAHSARLLPSSSPAAPRPLTVGSIAGAVSIIMFAFTSQVNVPEVYLELRMRSPGRMRHVASCAVGTALTLYILIGIAAFLEFGAETKADVLENYDVWGTPRDRGMLPSFAFIACTIVMAYPLNVFPARHTLLAAFEGADATEAADADTESAAAGVRVHGLVKHTAATLAITAGSLVVAVFVPGINVVFSLLGGTCSAFVCFYVPGELARRARVPMARTMAGRTGIYALMAGGALVGIVSTAVTVAGLVHS